MEKGGKIIAHFQVPTTIPAIAQVLDSLVGTKYLALEEGPMAGSVPFTHETRPMLEKLAALNPATLACMHGSSFAGDGAQALRDLGVVLERNFGPDGK